MARICKNCGERLFPTDTFCGFCGATVTDVVQGTDKNLYVPKPLVGEGAISQSERKQLEKARRVLASNPDVALAELERKIAEAEAEEESPEETIQVAEPQKAEELHEASEPEKAEDSPEPVKIEESPESQKAEESEELAEDGISSEPVEAEETPEPEKTEEPTETTETQEPSETSEIQKLAETAEITEAVNNPEPSEREQATEPEQAAETVEDNEGFPSVNDPEIQAQIKRAQEEALAEQGLLAKEINEQTEVTTSETAEQETAELPVVKEKKPIDPNRETKNRIRDLILLSVGVVVLLILLFVLIKDDVKNLDGNDVYHKQNNTVSVTGTPANTKAPESVKS